MLLRTPFVTVGLFLLHALAHAGNSCTWETAATRYSVSPFVLYAIAQHESSLNPQATRKNQNGTYDIGLMQINSSWLPHLEKFGIKSVDLFDPCINLNVGAYILAKGMVEHGNTWQAIGTYHSRTPSRRDDYAQAIYRRLNRMGLIPKSQNSAEKSHESLDNKGFRIQPR